MPGKEITMLKLCFSLALVALLPALTGAQDELDRYRNANRLLLVFAPGPSDPCWQRQEKILAHSQAAFADRDLLRFDLFQTPKAAAVRARYQVRPGQFRVFLIGKDGHVASSRPTPVSLNELTGQIDRMPMRREEMQQKEEMRRRGK